MNVVLASLADAGGDGRTTRELMAVVNLGMGRLDAMLKILDVEGAVARDGSRWKLVPGSSWSLSASQHSSGTSHSTCSIGST